MIRAKNPIDLGKSSLVDKFLNRNRIRTFHPATLFSLRGTGIWCSGPSGTKAKPNTNEIREGRIKNAQDENSPEKFEVEVNCGTSDTGKGEVKSK